MTNLYLTPCKDCSLLGNDGMCVYRTQTEKCTAYTPYEQASYFTPCEKCARREICVRNDETTRYCRHFTSMTETDPFSDENAEFEIENEREMFYSEWFRYEKEYD